MQLQTQGLALYEPQIVLHGFVKLNINE